MIPVVTPEEMGEIDRAAPEPVEELIGRAGAAVARAALDLLGGAYGRRVVVVAGKGNNGADGRAAARRLERRGVRVEVLDAADLPDPLPPGDLLIDAAYGTGFRGEWKPPDWPGPGPVLAVDVPSGVDGLTGVASGAPWAADRTVTFAALKPGLLLGDGPALAGTVEVADIGLDVARATIHRVTGDDVTAWLPSRGRDAHKWRSAAWIVAGSPGMTGAARLSATAALRSGAGYVRLSVPGAEPGAGPDEPIEAVRVVLPASGWAATVTDDAGRFGAIAVGPGLGPGHEADVRALVGAAGRPPLVVDGDGLRALDPDHGGPVAPGGPAVLTPHDGEVARLGGDPRAADRVAELRALAVRFDAVVLGKGAPTVVAGPDGRVLIAATGDARLASAGTGDVLTGTIAALLAQGIDPLRAAAAGAHVHGLAGRRAGRRGVVAGDVAAHLPSALTDPSEV
ncbi:MAG: NAD(P)H-hydrate dehydratase [Acidimicrobiales bacterium]|nr:NAD(P)H-hydrate dehydratase [Acidimicrobiales bacterium]